MTPCMSEKILVSSDTDTLAEDSILGLKSFSFRTLKAVLLVASTDDAEYVTCFSFWKKSSLFLAFKFMMIYISVSHFPYSLRIQWTLLIWKLMSFSSGN